MTSTQFRVAFPVRGLAVTRGGDRGPRLGPTLFILLSVVVNVVSATTGFAEGGRPVTAKDVTSPVLLGPGRSGVVMQPDGKLKLFVYEDGKNFSQLSHDGGRTWGERQFEFAGPACYLPLIDQTGAIHLLSAQERDERKGDERRELGVNYFIDILHVKSDATGKVWEKPKVVWRGYCGSVNGFTQLHNGRLVIPFAEWMPGRPEGPPHGANECLVIYSDDRGETWHESPTRLTAPCYTDFNGSGYGACEPCIIELKDGRCYMLARTETGMLYESHSPDGIAWEPLRPSSFLASDAPAGFLRIRDGRILVFYNGCEKPPRVTGAGVYGGRDVLHAAISDDEGRTWRGFREVYRDPTRNESPQRFGDRGTAYPFPYLGAEGKVIVVAGQGRSNGMLMFDPNWLLESGQRDDFSSGLDEWTVFKSIGPAKGWWRDRVPGAILSDHPDKPGAKVLHVRRPDNNDGDGAIWNFPLGTVGDLTVRLQLRTGFGGIAISLLDHFFDPQDEAGDQQAIFSLPVAADGHISQQAKLTLGCWHTLRFHWDMSAHTCSVAVDGAPQVWLKPNYRPALGINYIRFRSTAASIDTAGTLLESIEVDVRDQASASKSLTARSSSSTSDARDFLVVALGDSTTAPRTVDGHPLKVFADVLPNLLAGEGRIPTIVNAGVPGNDTDGARRRFRADVVDRHPQAVIIQFGINDAAIDVASDRPATMPRVALADFRRNLEFFVDELQRQHVEVLLLTPNPCRWTPELKKTYGKPPYRVDDGDGLNVVLKEYAEAVRQVAQNRRTPLVDVYARFQQIGATPGQTTDDLLLDGMHPNARGHQLIAQWIVEEWNKAKKRK